MQVELMILLRLLGAAVLAALLGWEREQAGKSAGFRTHMLVCIAAALYTGLGELAMVEGRGDPVRTIQAVAVGIGFLGSGMIFVSKDQDQVHGLTTAASIWATAAVGIAVGSGRYRLAMGATILLAFVLHVLARFDRPTSERQPGSDTARR